MNQIFSAIEFAAHAHNGQLRKGTNTPYIVHPIGVMQILLQYTNNPNVICAGILHDTLEDTPTTESDIQSAFGDRILELVQAASEPDKSLSWQQRKDHTIEYLRTVTDIDILLVCCADKLHNVQSMLCAYEQCGDDLWKRFNRGYDYQKWYYTSLAEIFMRHANKSELFSEFNQTVKKLFL